jgi:PAS domain S-box-containing protein
MKLAAEGHIGASTVTCSGASTTMSDKLDFELERQALDLAAVTIAELDGRIRLWTSGMQRLCGYTAEEAVGQIGIELVDARFTAGHDVVIAELEHSGRWNGEITYRARSGSRVTVAAECVVLQDVAGAPAAIATFHLDLARPDRGANQQNVLVAIVDNSDDAIVGKTLDGVVTSWNKGAERIFGYAAEEMVGHTLERLFPPELFLEEADILRRLARGERVAHYETTRLRKDGDKIEVSMSVSPVRDRSGTVVAASQIARNITGRKRVRARLEELQAELFHVSRLNDMGQVAAGLAHELNQPLSAIANYIAGARELIERGEPARAIEGCERAAAQVARASDVIRRLRDFVGKAASQKQPDDLRRVIEESAMLALIGGRGDDLKLELTLAPDAAVAMMDKVQIQQVLVNIIRNGAEAMAASAAKRLEISTRRTGSGEIEVAIADSGPGLSEAMKARLFQPFNTTKESGMGLGLSLCQSIVEAHGGRIWAESGAGGGGVTFRFTLPSD